MQRSALEVFTHECRSTTSLMIAATLPLEYAL
jgi:hypothetical protein